ncbi:hypothetical protein MC378_12890 [Polaribacter sp. MSW13]|uniref:PsbP C-terminal domain-containing protein n=1 Tax=Polaribacter marinus TaxID=2916838 RepID=A0A9X2AL10_9FLAO|nr:hypothetical protein [Polaribacter marinus]MCI2230068.1 hypothetical protein [Polaribacter marinus]
MKKYKTILIFFFFTLNLISQNKTEVYETDNYFIKYPIDWNLNSSGIGNTNFAVTSPLSSKEDGFSENVNLIIQDLKGMKFDLDRYTSISKQQLLSIPKGEILDSKRIRTEGLEYHTLTFKGFLENRNLKGKQIYIIKNKKAYVLTYTALEKDYELYLEKANRILKSFKLK